MTENPRPFHPDPERDKEIREDIRENQERFESNRSTIFKLARRSIVDYLVVLANSRRHLL